MQQKETAASAARMERRGKSSPAHARVCGHVNPIRCNTDWDEFAGPAVPTGGEERAGRPAAKIDCRTRQNPAYRSAHKKRTVFYTVRFLLTFYIAIENAPLHETARFQFNITVFSTPFSE